MMLPKTTFSSDSGLLLLWSMLLASSFVFSAQIVEFASPVVNTWFRFILAAVVLLPFVFRQLKAHCNPALVLKYLGATCCLIAFFLGFFKSLEYTTAFKTSIIYSFLPLLTLLFDSWMLKSYCNWQKVPGFLLGSTGAILVLIMVRSEAPSTLDLNIGDVLFTVATVFLAVHVVLAQKLGQRIPVLVSTFFILALGSVLLTPFAVMELPNVSGWASTEYWLRLLWLAVFTTLATVLLQQRLVKKVGSSRFIAYSYLIPALVAIMDGTLNLHNAFASSPGLLLVLGSLLLIKRASEQCEQPA